MDATCRAALLAVLATVGSIRAYDGVWAQVLPPAITVGVAAVYLLATKAGGESRQYKALNARGMQQLADGDTADAIESLTAAHACYENDLSERGRAKHRGTYQKTAQRLGEIAARRATPTAQTVQEPEPPGDTSITAELPVAEESNGCGLSAVADSLGWAYVDTTGAVVIRPFVFDNGPDPFAEGLARFTQGGLFGFFDTCGTVVIQPRFTFVKPFADGVAEYCEGCTLSADGEYTKVTGGVWHRIDRTGAVLPDKEP
jgi:hypothetical protein